MKNKPARAHKNILNMKPSSVILAEAGKVPAWAIHTAESLLTALKERDPYTYGHSKRVARNAKLLAKFAGLSEYEQAIVEYSSLFHDLGKLSIPDRILLKPGRLSPDEEAIMKLHPTKSAEIIEPLAKASSFFQNTLGGIKFHHERIDGGGYPDGIAGDKIPISARMILIADTFDAMTTTRPYRKGMASEIAYKELKHFSGRQFDAHLVDIFLSAHPEWSQFEEEITEEYVASNFRRAA